MINPRRRVPRSALFQGAICGGVLGFIFPMWISIGAYVTKPDVLENLNTTTEGCNFPNTSLSLDFYEELHDSSPEPATLSDTETYASLSRQKTTSLNVFGSESHVHVHLKICNRNPDTESQSHWSMSELSCTVGITVCTWCAEQYSTV